METTPTTARKTYSQNWEAYNAAQTSEKHRFLELLHDLCKTVPPFPRKDGTGRMPVPASDAVFATVFKIYSTFSMRRFASDLKDAHEKGFITKPLHYNSISAYLTKSALTMRLHKLIRLSSLPFTEIEKTFATDSSGFSVSRLVNWRTNKKNMKLTGHDWVKFHIICGIKTHVIVAVEIRKRHSHDSPVLPSMLNAAAANFEIDEVLGDNAYASRVNMRAVEEKGGTPYFNFKKSNTGGIGGIFEKHFLRFCLNREEYQKRYSRRNNVEALFSSLQRKFGTHVRSKTKVAMTNEVLAKILCHNLCCLIQSEQEFGVDPTFTSEPSLPRPYRNFAAEVPERL